MLAGALKHKFERWAVSLGCAAALLLSGPALAEDWQGVVIGQSGITTPRAFGDAFHAAEAFRAGGIDVVQVLRDQPRDTVMAAFDSLTVSNRAVIYLSGPLAEDGTGIVVQGGILAFDAMMTRLAQAGLSEVAVLVENCPVGTMVVIPQPQDGVKMLRAASAAPGGVCPADGARLTDLLRMKPTTETGLAALLSDVWTASDLETGVTLQASTEQVAPVVSLASSPVVSIIDRPVVSLTPISAPTAVAGALVPVSLQTSSQPSVGEVVIFAPTPQSQQAALPRAAGLPEPSIIVGVIEEITNASFSPAEPLGDVTSNEISYENLEARRALRAQDVGLFKTLVEGGAFDPPAALLATALQTELARMGCYRSGIDGKWGNGSRSSVSRYFDEIDGIEAVSLDPTEGLFRQIVLQDDITCAAPVAAAAPRATTRRTNTTASQPRTTARQAAPRRTAPAPKPKAAAPKRTISSGSSLGIFR